MVLFILFVIMTVSVAFFVFINRSLQNKRESRRERMQERRQAMLQQLLHDKEGQTG